LEIDYIKTSLFPSNESIISKRSLFQEGSSGFYCSFENVAPIAAQISENYTLFKCPSPNVAIESVLNLNLLFDKMPLAAPIQFGFIGMSQKRDVKYKSSANL
jgi:hypothetical protein